MVSQRGLLLGLCLIYAGQVCADRAQAECPLRYSHQDAAKEDITAFVERTRSRVRLGTYEKSEYKNSKVVDEQLSECIDANTAENLPPTPRPSDKRWCAQQFASLFMATYELENEGEFYARFRKAFGEFVKQWSFMFHKTPASTFEECGINLPAGLATSDEQELQMEVLLVMGLSRSRNQRSVGYWEAMLTDLATPSSVICANGCSRVFWIRKLVRESGK
jgi:hypothetical protein